MGVKDRSEARRSQHGTALIVFAKVPEPGRVKTRLTTLLTPDEAARLYRAFVHDALAQYAALDADVRLYLDEAGEEFTGQHEGYTLHRQQGDDLGARMQHAFVTSFAAGYDRLAIVGTDHPTLPTAFIEHAFVVLAQPQSICLGPSDDGGYYLLGMNDFYPSLFADMRYSHPDVFADTLARAGTTPAHVTILPSWYDVDTPEALRRLVADLDDGTSLAPRTRRIVASLCETYPFLAS